MFVVLKPTKDYMGEDVYVFVGAYATEEEANKVANRSTKRQKSVGYKVISLK